MRGGEGGEAGDERRRRELETFAAGLKAVADYVKTAFAGKSFRELAPQDQDKVLAGLESGSIALKGIEGAQFFALLLQNTQEGFFADPIYGGNRDKAGWKLIGFPGAIAVHRENVEKFRDKKYTADPVSIADMS